MIPFLPPPPTQTTHNFGYRALGRCSRIYSNSVMRLDHHVTVSTVIAGQVKLSQQP